MRNSEELDYICVGERGYSKLEDILNTERGDLSKLLKGSRMTAITATTTATATATATDNIWQVLNG